VPLFAVVTACHSKTSKPEPASSSPPIASAPLASSAPPAAKEAAPPACAPIDVAKLIPFATCGTKVVKTPVPEIVDPTATLASFYERMAELERGTATHAVRIAIYGDSNLTSDFLPGHLRRILQERYGDAGHGWISLSRPWGSYHHEDVVMKGFWPMFKLYAPTTHMVPDKQYGFANMAAQSSEIGAAAWAATANDAKATVGKTVSHFELHYLKQPRGGSFRLEIDRKELRKIETKAPAFEAGIESVDVEEGPHELRCVVVGDGPVRLFGTSLDRASTGPSKPGIQIDSLGAGALNYERLTWVANDTRRVQLAKRAYDLVVIWLGMNVMFVPPNRARAKEFIGALKEALPSTPILILSPSDTVKEGATKSDPRIVAVAKQMREVAAETASAFWDFREAMGGDGAVIGFTKRGLTGEDHIHFGPEGSHLMGDRLLCAVSSAFSAHLAAHPQAGCRAAPMPSTSGAPQPATSASPP
jgi:lysophospholipase L1-like esterase